MKELQVYDILLLMLIQDQPDLTYRGLHEELNKLIARLGIPSDYTIQASATSAVENSLRRLHAALLIDAPKPKATINRGFARELWERVGEDWRRWPYFIPIRDEGGLDYDQMKERD